MRPSAILALACLAFAARSIAEAQTEESTAVGVATGESRGVASGWSARHVLGRSLYNDQAKPERIGKIDDIIISPDKTAPYVIVNAAGQVGAPKHDVAVRITQLRDVAGKLVLPGATKDALQASPPFEYIGKMTATR
jgi:hypothetical protein